ncbi:hypothetical protein [Microbacterium excoecariae]|uniref:hypothetical protein n=1 Tax=Microbacterium excoecariae TaxID=2715210 RepID=UPI0014097F57|nr:hypothetical protein [Microbacterium excoecariae]NHI16844.1 hypothetical protein [Microbacterium excoecariae]
MTTQMNAELIAEARAQTNRPTLGVSTWRELDKAVVTIRRLAEALEGAERDRGKAKRAARILGEQLDRLIRDTFTWAQMEHQLADDYPHEPDQQMAWERCSEIAARARGEREPSDAEVMAAARAMYRLTNSLSMSGARDLARAALLAAQEVRRG